MDYEKAFKDAYKRASLRFGTNVANELFLEYKESKEERIRRGLIEYFYDWSKTKSYCWGIPVPDIMDWLEKQGQVKESEIREIQNGIILDGVVYELTTGFPDDRLSLCGNCELQKKCKELTADGSPCYFFADNFRKVFRKVKMERKL